MRVRKTEHFNTYGRPDPTASRIVSTFFRHCAVCVAISEPASWLDAGRRAPCPETKTNRSKSAAGEYGPFGDAAPGTTASTCSGITKVQFVSALALLADETARA